MPLQPLSDFQLDTIQRGGRSLHLQCNRRLEPALPGNALHVDRAPRHLQKWSDRIQHHVNLLLVQIRGIGQGLDDLLDFGDPLPELSLEAHFHRLGGAGTCSAIPLS